MSLLSIPIEEIQLHGPFESGKANKEYVALQVSEDCGVGQFGLMLANRAHNGAVFPITDNMLWLGDGFVEKGDWIFVYTGPGMNTAAPIPGTKNKMYTIYWGKAQTLFQNPSVIPILFRMDAVAAPPLPVAQLQNDPSKVISAR